MLLWCSCCTLGNLMVKQFNENVAYALPFNFSQFSCVWFFSCFLLAFSLFAHINLICQKAILVKVQIKMLLMFYVLVYTCVYVCAECGVRINFKWIVSRKLGHNICKITIIAINITARFIWLGDRVLRTFALSNDLIFAILQFYFWSEGYKDFLEIFSRN